MEGSTFPRVGQDKESRFFGHVPGIALVYIATKGFAATVQGRHLQQVAQTLATDP